MRPGAAAAFIAAESSSTTAIGLPVRVTYGPAIASTASPMMSISTKNIQSGRGHPPKRCPRRARNARNASTLETTTRRGRSRTR